MPACEDRSLVEQFIEEALRLESPTQGLYRVVATDTEINGVAIAKEPRYTFAMQQQIVTSGCSLMPMRWT